MTLIQIPTKTGFCSGYKQRSIQWSFARNRSLRVASKKVEIEHKGTIHTLEVEEVFVFPISSFEI